MELIDITKFGKFTVYDKEIVDFCNEKGIKIPKIETLRGQFLALMTDPQNHGKFANRTMMNDWIQSIGMSSLDVVQAINKTNQWGLKNLTLEKKWYSISYPFEYVDLHLKKRKLNKKVR